MQATDDRTDTLIRLVTPENIAFEYQLGGPFLRAWAYVLDLIFRMLIGFLFTLLVWLFTLLLSYLSHSDEVFGVSAGVWTITLFVLEWFYGPFFEIAWQGQTPGKWLTSIRVIGADGLPLAPWQAILRNVLRFVDLLGLGFVGLVSAASNPRFQRLGDLAAGTMVIVEQGSSLHGVVQFRDPRVRKLAEELPSKIPLRSSLVRALSNYVIRRTQLGAKRCEEIAEHVAKPLKQMFALPENTSNDLLLCALYHKIFHPEGTTQQQTTTEGSPFAFLENQAVGAGR